MSRYVGLDPSFTNTGIAVIDSDHKEIYLRSYGDKIGDKTFNNIVLAVEDRVKNITAIVGLYDAVSVITETPPPNSSFGSGLFALDTHLTLSLLNSTLVKEMYGVAPTFVAHIHGHKKYSKSESVKITRELIILFENNGYKVYYQGRLSNDMAEAFMFATRLLIRNEPNKFAQEICFKYQGFKDKKEFKLGR